MAIGDNQSEDTMVTTIETNNDSSSKDDKSVRVFSASTAKLQASILLPSCESFTNTVQPVQ